ncbi:MAG: YciI family protein [Planctomycetota bacterium]
MQYALLIHEKPEELAKGYGPDAPAYWEAWSSFTKAIEASGVMIGGAGLKRPETATTVTLAPGGPEIQDGPYAESKEMLGGFYLIDVPDLDAALAWAARIPSPGGKIEVRPLLEPETEAAEVAAQAASK